MSADEILKRIKSLQKKSIIPKPERIFYSGPNYSEEAIYFGDKKKYKDIIDFWVSILSWVSMDLIEFDDITIFNERKEYPSKINYCENIDLKSEKLERIIQKIRALNQFTEHMKIRSCYKMSNEWEDIKYMIDCEESFFLYNWYTGE